MDIRGAIWKSLALGLIRIIPEKLKSGIWLFVFIQMKTSGKKQIRS